MTCTGCGVRLHGDANGVASICSRAVTGPYGRVQPRTIPYYRPIWYRRRSAADAMWLGRANSLPRIPRALAGGVCQHCPKFGIAVCGGDPFQTSSYGIITNQTGDRARYARSSVPFSALVRHAMIASRRSRCAPSALSPSICTWGRAASAEMPLVNKRHASPSPSITWASGCEVLPR